jgi:hypothetical protein
MIVRLAELAKTNAPRKPFPKVPIFMSSTPIHAPIALRVLMFVPLKLLLHSSSIENIFLKKLFNPKELFYLKK